MNSELDRAFLLYSQGRYQQAESELRQYLRQESTDATAQALLALNLNQLNRYDEATRLAQQAIHNEPDLSFAHYALADVYYARNQYKLAQTAIAQAIQLNPYQPQFWALQAAIYFDQSQWQSALEAAEQGLQVDPENIGCVNLRAMSLQQLNRLQEAEESIQVALSQSPDDALTHANQGWLWLGKRQYNPAARAFQEALRIDPTLDWARRGMIQALKARNPLYRGFLSYLLWVSKLTPQMRWGLLIGVWFLSRLLRSIAKTDPTLGLLLTPVLLIYVLAIWLTWVAEPLSTLLLRLDRYGRLLLSAEEITASNWIGGLLLMILVGIGLGWGTGNLAPFLLGAIAALLVIPTSAIFNCDPGWPRRIMTIYTVVLAGCGLAAWGLLLIDPTLNGLLVVLAILFLLGVFLASWVANFLIQQTAQK